MTATTIARPWADQKSRATPTGAADATDDDTGHGPRGAQALPGSPRGAAAAPAPVFVDDGRRARWARRLGLGFGLLLAGWLALAGFALVVDEQVPALNVDASSATSTGRLGVPATAVADPAAGQAAMEFLVPPLQVADTPALLVPAVSPDTAAPVGDPSADVALFDLATSWLQDLSGGGGRTDDTRPAPAADAAPTPSPSQADAGSR